MAAEFVRLTSAFGTVLHYDEGLQRLCHRPPGSGRRNLLVGLSDTTATLVAVGTSQAEFSRLTVKGGDEIGGGGGQSVSDIRLHRLDQGRLALSHDGLFLSSSPDGQAGFQSPHCLDWESFTLQPADVLPYIPSDGVRGEISLSARDFRLDTSNPQLIRILRKEGSRPTPRHFTVAGAFDGIASLAAVNRRFASLIDAAQPGHCSVMPREVSLDDVPPAERRYLMALERRTRRPSDLHVMLYQQWPVLPPRQRGDVTLAYFFWEESLVPPSVVEALNEFDAVLTSADFIGPALHSSGLRRPIFNIGYSPDLKPFLRPGQRHVEPEPGRPFTFLHVSNGDLRKGTDLLLSAYGRTFKRSDDVCLLLRGPSSTMVPHLRAAREAFPQMAPVTLYDEALDLEQLARLYHLADCMVLPTRGEGFNVPAAEAIAAELGLIVTGYGGHMQFCANGAARLVRHHMAPSKVYLEQPTSLWAEPEMADLCAAMVEAKAGAVGMHRPLRAQALVPLGAELWLRRLNRAVDDLMLGY